MDRKTLSTYTSLSYADNALAGRDQYSRTLTKIVSQRRPPPNGLQDSTVRRIVLELSALDTSNHIKHVGIGEREGRIYSSIISERNFGLSHGIGRSGDVGAIQPKAIGSSVISKLGSGFALRMINLQGYKDAKRALVLPLATGMSIGMCLLTLSNQHGGSRRVIVWSRMDQKSCIKAVQSFGFQLVGVDMLEGEDGSVTTNLEGIREAIEISGTDNVLCVISTTSCFAPRQPDEIEGIASICRELEIAHLVNNAYGIQSRGNMERLQRATRGREIVRVGK